MLRAFKVPIGWTALAKRTALEVVADDCLGLAAQLAYYFVLALFPALLFLVALISFIPIDHLLDTIVGSLQRVAPNDVLRIVQDQILEIAHNQAGGLLTFGMVGTIWSSSSGVTAIIDSLNQAYDIREGRPWWKVRLTALGLTVALAIFIVLSTVLVVAGPVLARTAANWLDLGPAFEWTWLIVQWPLVFILVSSGVAIIYYYAPDAEQDWTWITPGSLLATLLWLVISLAFRFYVTHFGSYNATYGAIGGVIVLMLWFYLSALAVLVGAELNAEIEHASPYGKDPGEKRLGARAMIGVRAERTWQERARAEGPRSAWAGLNCAVDRELPPAVPSSTRPARASDWLLSSLVLGEAALMTYATLRARLRKVKH
jgi:membrane protein